MNITLQDEIYNNIGEFEKIIKINDNEIPKDTFSKNFLNDFKNEVDKTIDINELIKIKWCISNYFGMYITMCDIDTSNIKKSVLKKVDDKCNLNCFKELFDFAEEYTDYEGDETGLLEKTTYTTDEDYLMMKKIFAIHTKTNSKKIAPKIKMTTTNQKKY